MPRTLFFKFAFFVALLFSMYLFFDPGLDTGIRIPHIDKLGHFLAFGGLTFLFDFAFSLLNYWGMLLALIYGVAVELIQGTLPNRQASIADVIADMSGCLIYYFFFQKKMKTLITKWWPIRG